MPERGVKNFAENICHYEKLRNFVFGEHRDRCLMLITFVPQDVIMKIFRIDRQADRWPEAASVALENAEAAPLGVLPARLVADSAIIRNNRPVFVPDFAREGWVVEILPAIYIGRLGKFISPRFAMRYVEAFSLVACVRPAVAHVPDALTDSFDGAITVGVTMPFPERRGLKISARYEPLPAGRAARKMPEEESGQEPVSDVKDVDMTSLRVGETVALLSRYATLKSGDIIVPASIGLSFPVCLDYSLTAEVEGVPALSLRLK